MQKHSARPSSPSSGGHRPPSPSTGHHGGDGHGSGGVGHGWGGGGRWSGYSPVFDSNAYRRWNDPYASVYWASDSFAGQGGRTYAGSVCTGSDVAAATLSSAGANCTFGTDTCAFGAVIGANQCVPMFCQSVANVSVDGASTTGGNFQTVLQASPFSPSQYSINNMTFQSYPTAGRGVPGPC